MFKTYEPKVKPRRAHMITKEDAIRKLKKSALDWSILVPGERVVHFISKEEPKLGDFVVETLTRCVCYDHYDFTKYYEI